MSAVIPGLSPCGKAPSCPSLSSVRGATSLCPSSVALHPRQRLVRASLGTAAVRSRSYATFTHLISVLCAILDTRLEYDTAAVPCSDVSFRSGGRLDEMYQYQLQLTSHLCALVIRPFHHHSRQYTSIWCNIHSCTGVTMSDVG